MLRLTGAFLLLSLPLISLSQCFEILSENKWGLCDSTGATILTPQYDDLFPSADRSCFFLKSGDKIGLYQCGRGILMPCEFSHIIPWGDSLIQGVVNGKTGLWDSLGQSLVPPEYDDLYVLTPQLISVLRKDRWGAVGWDGIPILPFDFISMEASRLVGQRWQVSAMRPDSSLVTYTLIGTKLQKAFPYPVERMLGGYFVYEQGNKVGLLAGDGSVFVPAEYDSLGYKDSLFIIGKGKRLGLLNHAGETVLPIAYDRLEPDSVGAWWIKAHKEWGLADSAGRVLIAPRFSQVFPFHQKVAKVKENQQLGLINRFGEILVEPLYRKVQVFTGAARMLTEENEIEQVRFDAEGRPVSGLAVIVYDSQRKMEAGTRFRPTGQRDSTRRGPVARRISYNQQAGWIKTGNGKWGLRGVDGKWRIPPQYDFVYAIPNTNNSVIRRTESSLYEVINHVELKQVQNAIFARVYTPDFAQDTAARIQFTNGYFGLLFANGKYRRLGTTSYLGPFHKGIARVQVGGNMQAPGQILVPQPPGPRGRTRGKWGYLDPGGNFVLRPGTYDYVEDLTNGVARIYRAGKWGMIRIHADTLREVIAPILDGIDDPGPESPYFITYERALKFLSYDSSAHLLNTAVLSMQLDSNFTLIEEMRSFREGMAAAKSNGKWGFVNLKGEWVILPQYPEVGDFGSGLAPAREKGAYGFLDKQGIWVIKPKFRKAQSFQEGAAVIRHGKGWGMMLPNGKWLLKPKYRKIEAFSDGLAKVRKRAWGVINLKGKWVIPPRFGQVLIEGTYMRARLQGQSGLYDRKGAVVVPVQYAWLGPWQEGTIPFLKNSRYGFLNASGEVMIKATYEKVAPFRGGLAPVRSEGKWGYINLENEWVIQPQYEAAQAHFHGLLPVAKRGENRQLIWGLLNRFGREVLPFEYQSISSLEPSMPWLYAQKDQAYYLVDSLGYFLERGPFTQVNVQPRGPISVRQHQRMFCLDVYGNAVLPLGYPTLQISPGANILAHSNHLYGLLDRRGQLALAPIYDRIEFVGGLYRLEKDGEIAYLNQQGQWIISFKP